MEMPLADIMDRMTILKLKIERTNEQSPRAEYAEYNKSLKEFEKRGIKIKQEWFDELSKYNKDFCDNVIALKEAEDKGLGFAEMGKIYVKQRIANKKRIEVKNLISQETKTGFKAYKG